MPDFDDKTDFILNKLTAKKLGHVARNAIVRQKTDGLPGKGAPEGYEEWYIETPSEKRATIWPQGVWHRQEDEAWAYFFDNIRNWVDDSNAMQDDCIYPLLNAGTIATFEERDTTPRVELPGVDITASTRPRSVVCAWLVFMGVLPHPP